MNKAIPSKPKHLYGFLVEGFGLMFGKPIISPDNQFVGVKEPRIAKVGRDPNDPNKADLVFIQAIGEPVEIFFNKAPLFYENQDKKVLDKYTQSVSNIHLASVLPIGGKLQ